VKKKIVEALATGFYLGKAPFMPGTFGTLLGLPTVWLLSRISSTGYLAASFILLLLSVGIAELYEIQNGSHDPKEVVIDEVVGYVISMTLLPQTWQAYLAAFLIFRFFDILKPYPISYLDRNIRGGLGTVLDDVAAGLVTNIILQVVLVQTTWLGTRLMHGEIQF
jgi:phosphatidylglycerophosphatase A